MKKTVNIINNNIDSLEYLNTAGGSVNRAFHSGKQAISQRLNGVTMLLILILLI